MTISRTKSLSLRSAEEVTDANRRFYDEIAANYEAIDPRRNAGNAHAWLDRVLAGIATRLPKREVFLDAGAGTGFLVGRARSFFQRNIAVDVSEKMLEKIQDPGIEKICSNLSEIPLSANSIDCIGSFATLHHLHSPEEFFVEAHRLLREAGILYTDHDISSDFVARFGKPLAIYRKLCDHGKRYLSACPHARAEDYELSEFHGDHGLSGKALAEILYEIGFRKVELTYHWEGMGPFALAERLIPAKLRQRRGLSPIIRILAIK